MGRGAGLAHAGAAAAGLRWPGLPGDASGAGWPPDAVGWPPDAKADAKADAAGQRGQPGDASAAGSPGDAGTAAGPASGR